jgi:hypothetical protein
VVSLTGRSKAPALRDLIAADAPVVCVQGFRPYMGAEITRGTYLRLSDAVVRANPGSFAVAIPVADVLDGESSEGVR